MAHFARCGYLALALIALAGLEPVAASVSRQRVEAVVISLTIDKPRYTTREEVKITLAIRNRTRATVSYQFSSSQWYDLQVVSRSEVLWSWSHDKVFTQAFTTLSLEPGRSRTFTLSWNLRSNDGSRVTPGSYTLVATFPMSSGHLPSSAYVIKIPFLIVE